MESIDPCSGRVPVVTRRRSARVPVRLPVTVLSTFRTAGTVQNLSGCAIDSPTYYQVGEQVRLDFVVPTLGPVTLQAEVRWAALPFMGVALFGPAGASRHDRDVCGGPCSPPAPGTLGRDADIHLIPAAPRRSQDLGEHHKPGGRTG